MQGRGRAPPSTRTGTGSRSVGRAGPPSAQCAVGWWNRERRPTSRDRTRRGIAFHEDAHEIHECRARRHHEVQREDRNRERRSPAGTGRGTPLHEVLIKHHIWRAARMQLEKPGSCCQVDVRAAPNVFFRAERALVQGGNAPLSYASWIASGRPRLLRRRTGGRHPASAPPTRQTTSVLESGACCCCCCHRRRRCRCLRSSP
jgi:hypothetical protein